MSVIRSPIRSNFNPQVGSPVFSPGPIPIWRMPTSAPAGWAPGSEGNWYYDHPSGLWKQAATGEARLNHWMQDGNGVWHRGLLLETTAVTQYVNNTNVGAALGVVGSGGSLPTGWVWSPSIPGAICTVTAVDIDDDGLPYFTVELVGNNTSGASKYPSIYFDVVGVGSAGQKWSVSTIFKTPDGPLSHVCQYSIYDKTNIVITYNNFSNLPDDTRLIATCTVGGTTPATMSHSLIWTVLNGQSFTVSLKIKAAELYAASDGLPSPILAGTSPVTRLTDPVMSMPWTYGAFKRGFVATGYVAAGPAPIGNNNEIATLATPGGSNWFLFKLKQAADSKASANVRSGSVVSTKDITDAPKKFCVAVDNSNVKLKVGDETPVVSSANLSWFQVINAITLSSGGQPFTFLDMTIYDQPMSYADSLMASGDWS